MVADLGYREKNNDFHAEFAGLRLDGNTKVQTLSFSPRIQIPYSALGNSNNIVVGLDREDWNTVPYASIQLRLRRASTIALRICKCPDPEAWNTAVAGKQVTEGRVQRG